MIASPVGILPAFDPVKILLILRCEPGNFLDLVVVCVLFAPVLSDLKNISVKTIANELTVLKNLCPHMFCYRPK